MTCLPVTPSCLSAYLPLPARLSVQLGQARSEASAARSEASRAAAESEFERERGTRLVESLEMQRQQVESLINSNTKYQALLTETERKLAQAAAAADEARDTVSSRGMGRQWAGGQEGCWAGADSEVPHTTAPASCCPIPMLPFLSSPHH